MNGSPLFTGDAGSGESEIRRCILENDLLEALIALPEQLFYNTGIATYVWVVTNRKAPARAGKVQLIDATSFWVPMRKSLGDKRREIPLDRAKDMLDLLRHFQDGETRTVSKDGKEEEVVVSQIFPTTALRLPQDHGRAAAPAQLPGGPSASRASGGEGASRRSHSRRRRALPARRSRPKGARSRRRSASSCASCPATLLKDRERVRGVLKAHATEAEVSRSAPLTKAILSALSERDETAAICRDAGGAPEPDPELRDTESVPLAEPVEAFFEREVKPHVPDAWIDRTRCDPKDGKVGLVGYEINFNRYFYRYTPPRPLEEIEADIAQIEKDIVRMLAEVTGRRPLAPS